MCFGTLHTGLAVRGLVGMCIDRFYVWKKLKALDVFLGIKGSVKD